MVLFLKEKIASINNLYKIVYSTVSVMDRIKNATKEATYLKAEVQLISTFQCYNMNTHKFENLLHRFTKRDQRNKS